MNLTKVLNSKCIEPEKRNKDGYRWVIHRFPIKGGISIREAWIRDLSRSNSLLLRLKNKSLLNP